MTLTPDQQGFADAAARDSEWAASERVLKGIKSASPAGLDFSNMSRAELQELGDEIIDLAGAQIIVAAKRQLHARLDEVFGLLPRIQQPAIATGDEESSGTMVTIDGTDYHSP